MGNADRPALTPSQEIAIESAQNDVDGEFWRILWEFQALMPHAQLEYDRRNRTNRPTPKEPAKFQWVIGEYARNLFIIEARVYPDALELREWLTNLSKRVMERVSQKLDEIENRGQLQDRSFVHHGVIPDQIISTMRGVLASAIEVRLASYQPISLPPPPPPPPPEVTAQMQSQPSTKSEAAQDTEPNESEVERRGKLLAEYKLETGASNRKIYEARNSGIYKPEFYKWLDGTLPSESSTSINFERFLRAQKPPMPRKPKA
jgi:hypothetical protein